MPQLAASLLFMGAAATASLAAAPPRSAPFAVHEVWTATADALRVPGSPAPTHALRLELALLAGTPWQPERLREAIGGTARILAQCGIAIERAELQRIDAPPDFRDFANPTARELVRRTHLRKPTLYFVADSRQHPAFDAEAVGRGNGRGREELIDTVWITAATPDLAVAMAHELVHLLTESGAHEDSPRNLMRDETAPGNTELTPAQCASAREVGSRKGLLTSLAAPPPAAR